MNQDDNKTELSDKEVKSRMDDALKRALSTSPKPHKTTQKKNETKAAAKPRRTAKRDGA